MIRKSSSSSSSSLAPGYRFHPTDEELVGYYLSRKVRGIPYIHGPISDIDIYKAEPWDLPGKSALKTRDLEWYFFSSLDKKYGNGDRTNRATQQGYWKTTGKDRPVYHKAQVVGMKKTLVYHNGRAPKGMRTNWVMHEYRVTDENLVKKGFAVEAFVLCRIFQKSGSGPKNGEQYGAPLVEEEWEVDDFGTGLEMQVAEEVEFCDDGCLDGLHLDQILATGVATEDSPIEVADHQYGGENVTSSEGSPDSNNELRYASPGFGMVMKPEGNELYEMPAQGEVNQAVVNVLPIGVKPEGNQFYEMPAQGEVHQAVPQVPMNAYEYRGVPQQSEDQKLYNMLEEYTQQLTPVKYEYNSEQAKILNPEDTNYLLDQSFVDAMDDPQFGEGGAFLEASDLDGPIGDASGDGDNWSLFFDSSNDYLNFDDSFMVDDNSALLPGESPALQMDSNGQQLLGSNIDEASSSSRLQSTKDCATDIQYPFLKKASCMLESIQAPPAYASEFPSKDAALHLYASSSASHITAGLIEIQDTGLANRKIESVSEKDGRYKIVVSFGMSTGADNSTTLESAVRIHPGKNVAGAFGGWFTSMFLVLILSMALKFGTYIYAQ